MTQEPQNPGRRQLLAAVMLADADSLFQRLREPKSDSYREWFEAVRIDDVKRVQSLLARGFDPNSVEPERFDTALILSVRLKSSKVFSALLEAQYQTSLVRIQTDHSDVIELLAALALYVDELIVMSRCSPLMTGVLSQINR